MLARNFLHIVMHAAFDRIDDWSAERWTNLLQQIDSIDDEGSIGLVEP